MSNERLQEALQAWTSLLQVRSAETARSYRRCVGRFLRSLGDAPIDAHAAAAYLASLDDLAPASIAHGGQMVELELATQLSVVTIVLTARGSDRSFMTVASALRSSVMSEAEYGDDDIGEVLARQTSWAEATLARLSRDYEKSFPWRGATAP